MGHWSKIPEPMWAHLTVVEEHEAEDANGGVDGDGPVEGHAEPSVHRQIREEGRRVNVLQPVKEVDNWQILGDWFWGKAQTRLLSRLWLPRRFLQIVRMVELRLFSLAYCECCACIFTSSLWHPCSEAVQCSLFDWWNPTTNLTGWKSDFPIELLDEHALRPKGSDRCEALQRRCYLREHRRLGSRLQSLDWPIQFGQCFCSFMMIS